MAQSTSAGGKKWRITSLSTALFLGLVLTLCFLLLNLCYGVQQAQRLLVLSSLMVPPLYYIYSRVWVYMGISSCLPFYGFCTLTLLAFPLGASERFLSNQEGEPYIITSLCFVGLGFFLVCLNLTAILDIMLGFLKCIVQLVHHFGGTCSLHIWIGKKGQCYRARFLLLTSILVTLAAFFSDGKIAEVKHVEIVMTERFPSALDGYRLVMLSDLHIGPTIGRRQIQHVVDQTNSLNPHAVMLVGDIVDGHAGRYNGICIMHPEIFYIVCGFPRIPYTAMYNATCVDTVETHDDSNIISSPARTILLSVIYQSQLQNVK